MFKYNNDHYQQDLFSHHKSLRPAVADMLERTWAPIFYEHVFCKVDEAPFAELYSSTGRKNFPVNILLSLEIIKGLFDYTDREILDQFHFNYQVIYALGIKNFGVVSLSERTIYEFRERVFKYIVAHPDQEDPLFKQFEALTSYFIKTAGIKTQEQRVDSTLISPNIKKAGRLSLAHDVLKQAVSAIPQEYLSESLKAVLENSFKNNLLYYTKNQEMDSRLQIVLDLMAEALSIATKYHALEQQKAIQIAKRFLSEQAYFSQEEQRYLPLDKKDIAASSLQSAYDTDATFRNKAGKKHSGYVLNISETCSKNNELQLITDYTVQPNNVSDVELIESRLAKIKNSTNVEDMYGDGGFYSEALADNELGVRFHYTDMTGTKPKEDLLPLTSFSYEDTAKMIIAQCPNGQKPLRSDYRHKTKCSHNHFAIDTCMNCPKRGNCPAKQLKNSFVVRITRMAFNAATVRKELADRNIKKENTSKRSAIEGTNSALKRAHGLDKLRTRGIVRCTMDTSFRIIASNCKKIIRFFADRRVPKPAIPKGVVSPLAC